MLSGVDQSGLYYLKLMADLDMDRPSSIIFPRRDFPLMVVKSLEHHCLDSLPAFASYLLTACPDFPPPHSLAAKVFTTVVYLVRKDVLGHFVSWYGYQ